MSKKQPPSFLKAYKELTEQVEQGKPEPKERPQYLSLPRIRQCQPVFQHRRPEKHTSEAHIKELAKAPQQGSDLDPIIVWWDGKGWVCIDGHHRIAAYRHAQKGHHDVPVEIFSGTIEQAIARAAKGNTRDKLPMSSREKTETAWRITIADISLSKAKVAELSGASSGIVASMRRVKAQLLQQAPQSDLSELSWAKARTLAAGKSIEEVNWEERVEKEAQQFADTLAKHLGKRGHQRREAFARALEIYDGALPGFLREHWALASEEDEEE